MTHTCHAFACRAPVAPSYLMCAAHWALVPAALRGPLLRAYRPGQCHDKQPSASYNAAQRACVAHVARVEGHAQAADYYAAMATYWRRRATGDDPPLVALPAPLDPSHDVSNLDAPSDPKEPPHG